MRDSWPHSTVSDPSLPQPGGTGPRIYMRDSWPHFTVSDPSLPQPGGPVPVFISPRNRVTQLYPQALGSFFVASESESDSYITTDGQAASLSWNKAPIWGLRPDNYYCQTVAGFLMWGALSDERTGLLFAIAAGPDGGGIRPHESTPFYNC
jgi:hypothetical protein